MIDKAGHCLTQKRVSELRRIQPKIDLELQTLTLTAPGASSRHHYCKTIPLASLVFLHLHTFENICEHVLCMSRHFCREHLNAIQKYLLVKLLRSAKTDRKHKNSCFMLMIFLSDSNFG